MRINYLNLSNGIKYIDKFNNIKFVRIQSTLLECHKFDKVIYELDYGFLLDLSRGFDICVIDTSANKDKSRAIFQGIPWIEYVLNRYWLDKEIKVFVKKCNVSNYFRDKYNDLSKCTKSKLRYFKKLLNPDLKQVKINSLCFGYEKDIRINEFQQYIKKYRNEHE